MNKYSARNILFLAYAIIAGALFGGAFAFFIIIPIFRIILASIIGSDAGPRWTIYFINIILTIFIIGGSYINVKRCLSYAARKKMGVDKK